MVARGGECPVPAAGYLAPGPVAAGGGSCWCSVRVVRAPAVPRAAVVRAGCS